MELVRWKPRRYVPSVYGDVDRLFDSFLKSWASPEALSESGWSPSVDVYDGDSELVISAEVPGMDPENVEVSVEDDQLVISGEKRQENEEKGDHFYRVERSYGSFKRVFSLPRNVDASKVKASSKNGVLRISVPKREVSDKKKIDVQAE